MDNVPETEVLYRGVRADRNLYEIQPDGTVRFTSEAFRDKNQQPSVDRATLCDNSPSHAQKDPSDGVTSLIAGEVKKIDEVGQYTKDGALVPPHYQIDTKPDPIIDHPTLPNNPAHAVIYSTPACRNDGEFKKLKRALARIASLHGWLIKPQNGSD